VDPALSIVVEKDDHYHLLVMSMLNNLLERALSMSSWNADCTQLLKITDWDLHLDPYIKTMAERHNVLALVKLPEKQDESMLYLL
jgi:hypothetical protein